MSEETKLPDGLQLAVNALVWHSVGCDGYKVEIDAIRAEHAKLAAVTNKAGELASDCGICEAVIHHATGRLNGWFHLPGMAADVAHYFRECFQDERFSVVALLDRQPGEDITIAGDLWLDAIVPPAEQGLGWGYSNVMCKRMVFGADTDPEVLPAILVTRSGKNWSVTIGDTWRYRMHMDVIFRNTRELLMCQKLSDRWPVWSGSPASRSKMVLMHMTGIFNAPEYVAREAVEIICSVFPCAAVKWPQGAAPEAAR